MIDFNPMAKIEPSAQMGFSGNRLIRDAEHRDETQLEDALTNKHARYLVFGGNKVILRHSDNGSGSCLRFNRDEMEALDGDVQTAILLGTDESAPVLAVTSPLDLESLKEPLAAYDLRSLLYSGHITDADAGAVAQAGSMLHWHATNQYCGRCGTASMARIGGFRRDCPECGLRIFPRTDPVVIMLPVSGERCVMGRSPHFPAGWYSTLAGFVEPGETMEAAVRREVQEESGIHVGRVRYHASQPWPFPHTLMIGFHCEAVSEKITLDDNELEDCRWFDRDEVSRMLAGDHPDGLACPPLKAISSALIKAWIESG